MATDALLNGVKQFITSGRNGDVAIVMAVTDRNAGKKGISAFIVPTEHARLSRRAHRGQDGPAQQRHRADPVRELPRAGGQPIGDEGQGLKIALPGLEGGRIGIAAQCVGMARAAFEAALALQQGAHRLRRADLRAPGGAVPPGRDGDADRGRAPAHPWHAASR